MGQVALAQHAKETKGQGQPHRGPQDPKAGGELVELKKQERKDGHMMKGGGMRMVMSAAHISAMTGKDSNDSGAKPSSLWRNLTPETYM